MIDVGGKSTRPGAEPVVGGRGDRPRGPGDRGDPRGTAAPISVDTMKPQVARAAVGRGRRPCGTTSPPCAMRRKPGGRPPSSAASGADAHAGRAADHAGRAPLRRRRGRGDGLPRRPGGGGDGRRRGARADLARSWHRLRQDHGPPQPAAARRAWTGSSPWASRCCWASAARASSPRSTRGRAADERLGGSIAAALAGGRAGVAAVRVARRARDGAGGAGLAGDPGRAAI